MVIDCWRIDRDFLWYDTITPGVDPRQKKDAAYDYLAERKDEAFRVASLDRIIARDGSVNLRMRYKYPDVIEVSGSHDFPIRRFDMVMRLVAQYGQQALPGYLRLVSGQYIVTPQKQPGTVFSSDRYHVVRNTAALPYFYVRNRAAVMNGEEQILLTIFNQTVNIDSTAIIEAAPPAGFESMLTETEQGASSVEIEKFELREGDVRLNVTLEKPGMLIFSENYHEFWSCTVDGGETPIHRANFLFQGVYLEPGEHAVRFTCSNPHIAWSERLMLTSFGLLVLLFGLAYSPIMNKGTETGMPEERKNAG